MIQDLAPGIVIYARRITKMKIILTIVLGMVIGLVSVFLLSIMGHIMIKYLGVIFRRIDYYFDQREIEKEQKEIYDFKRKL